ncbi:MAG TPA: hypothetical protein PLE78_01635 [Flavobacteriales bacterium]|nr:hypothetical protein [Flavobacteriales bacterium]
MSNNDRGKRKGKNKAQPLPSLGEINAAYLSTESESAALQRILHPPQNKVIRSPRKYLIEREARAKVIEGELALLNQKKVLVIAELAEGVKRKRGQKLRSELKELTAEINSRNRTLLRIRTSAFQVFKIKVWELTEAQPLDQLENFELRSWKGWHIDHVLSIAEGYKLGLPAETLACISNLRMLPAENNISKHTKTVFTDLFNKEK